MMIKKLNIRKPDVYYHKPSKIRPRANMIGMAIHNVYIASLLDRPVMNSEARYLGKATLYS